MVEAQPITEEVLETFDSIQVEGQSIIEIGNEQALGIQVLQSAPIVKIEKNHDCSVNTMKVDQRHATSKLISVYIIDNLRDLRFEVTPAFVMAEMQKLHGLDIGYHKAWRAIQRVSALIRGTPEENYELLSSYLYMMRSKNPGTYTDIMIDDNNRFLYMFYAYGSLISGWNHCRPVIAVDATFLKSKVCGVLMISVSKDANNQTFPLVFGIAKSENNNSYEWYFSELRNAIESRENLIFLSDRHQSIAYSIAKVYPESHHWICIYHLEQNLKRRKVKNEVIKLFQSGARVYRRKEFDLYMSDITKVDKKTYDYLMEEPPERWARSCSPRRRYDMLTTNIVEPMNYVLLEAREFPILRMMDFDLSEATTLVL
uniref:Protein FAR1-RELATED SEQUENCE 4-like n=1 Tax=Nicotiana tabacum TaxID=4097 RepID=A0A1S3ZK02_TOBAC|nr:PREDICTED: protein FAR1-RELATED SEQUENCE 4-like [Nicotiana tabacum]